MMVGCAKGKCGAPRRLLSADDAPDGTFAVIDPFSQRLFVPRSSMMETLALYREGVPSLCRLHLQGRCRQGSTCRQAHADLATVDRLREIALEEPTCCEKHGAISDISGISRDLTIIVFPESEHERLLRAPLALATVTKGLREFLKKQELQDDPVVRPTVMVPFSSLCRLHSCGPCCRFGHQCKFIHLCRELIAKSRGSNEEDEHKDEGALQKTDAPSTGRSPSRSSYRAALLPDEGDVLLATSPMQFSAPHGSFFSRQMLNGVVSLSGTPKLGTSSALSRSYNSTSLGIVWRHNPYGGGSSASSVVET